MAVTKTHPIKSTLKAAIDYILNPEKTDGKLLASSFGCGLETADIEFAWTREAAGDRGTHLGRHLIQSFAVGETTPEEAHKIGMELAGAVLGGKYEFVLTTHVDKDHLHNHLIFNAVSFVDYKKYHSNKQSYHFIRRTSDRICKEHGLSVVVPGQDKGKSYAEYTAEKQGTSYKAKLKTAIDTLIPQVKDFDELLRRLQEMGYEIKQGKYISFRAAGQERFTRTKTLGAAYTEEAIKERIKGVYVAKTKTLREDKKIRLVVDLENSIKAQQSAGYERWAKIHNLKQAAKSMNFLTENKIEYYSELESKIADIMTAHDAAAKAVKEVEQRIAEAFYGIPAVLIAECKSRIDKGLMTDVLDEFDHVLGRSVDTYSDEVDETQANQMIEAAIDQYYIQQDKNGMLLFMEVMVTRMQQAGEVIVPYITENPFMSEEQISKVKAGDTISLDHDVRLKIETVKDADEKEWIGVFTSSEEMHKGSAGNVQMNQSIESILRLALNWEQVNGIVINPFGKYIQMTKKMIELLINGYEYNENERKSKDDENN